MELNVEIRGHEVHLQHLISSNCPTMKLDAAGGPRILFGECILRAVGLDELPQIFQRSSQGNEFVWSTSLAR
jgi:hypothetical protein